MKNVAINGFGRIGRTFLKLSLTDPKAVANIQVTAINDLGDLDNIIYLLKYDSVHHKKIFKFVDKKIVSESEKYLVVELPTGEKKEIRYLGEKDTNKFVSEKTWGNLKIDIVVECTGIFTSADKSHFHIESGASRVVLSAPAKDKPGSERVAETVLMGVNEEELSKGPISSNASCTTNASSPVIKILEESIGIEKALLNTIHSYTATQHLIDGMDAHDYRKGRAGAQNIVPTSTGAAIAVTQAFPQMVGLFDGISVRVPSIDGSLADITFIAKRDTSVEEVNRILTNAAQSEHWQNIFSVTNEPIVSSDIIGVRYASIADLQMTRVVGGNLVKVLAWYDNEVGYTQTLIDHVVKVSAII